MAWLDAAVSVLGGALPGVALPAGALLASLLNNSALALAMSNASAMT